MSDKAKSPATAAREARLRAALRENLKRRKLQARGRAAAPDPKGPGDRARTDAGGGGGGKKDD